MENSLRGKTFSIILISLVFGIVGGIGGELLTRFYVLQNIFKVPMFGEISVPENVYSGSNLIIESPKKVVVEQNTKVLETLNSVNKNIIGIFDAKPSITKATSTIATTSKIFVPQNNYNLNNYRGQGFVITSDGWIISNFIPEVFLDSKTNTATTSTEKIKVALLPKFVIINNEGKIYKVIDFTIDKNSGVTFWRVEAKDLSVRQFKKISDIEKGQLVVATNFKGKSLLTTISGKYVNEQPSVYSSEKIYSEISLVNEVDKNFNEGFLFNTDGDLIAILKYGEAAKPVSSFYSCLKCLFDKKEFSKPYLGIYYLNLFNYSDPLTKEKFGDGVLISPNEDGISIIKNSPAELAGLKKGDVIKTINAIKIDRNNNFSDILSEYSTNEKISFTIERGQQEMQIDVSLGSVKEIDWFGKN